MRPGWKSVLFGVALAAAGAGAEVEMPTGDIRRAKELMAQGQRRRAVQTLDKLRTRAKTRARGRELEAKRALFAEQFITSEAFQKYQEAKGLADLGRWDDCVREADTITGPDQDNLMVLRCRALCQVSSGQLDAASKTYRATLELLPGDVEAVHGLVDVAIRQKRLSEGLSLLDSASPEASLEIERAAILRARLLEQSGRGEEAADLMRRDHETHLDHVEVLYELGTLYARTAGRDWPARKALSLFVSRCKRMKDADLKARRLNERLSQAQELLAAIDRRLGV